MTGIFHRNVATFEKKRNESNTPRDENFSTYEFAINDPSRDLLWIPCIQLDPNWKAICPQLNRVGNQYVGANIYEALDPITEGQKNTMNLKRGPANCTTETFKRARDTKIPSFPFVFARYKEREREREGGELNEASIIIGHARRGTKRGTPLVSLIAITGRSRGDRKVLTGNGIPADRINRTC